MLKNRLFYFSHLAQEEFGKISQIKDGLALEEEKKSEQCVIGRRRESSTSFCSSYFKHQGIGYSPLWCFQIVLKFCQKVIYRTLSGFILVHFPWLKSSVQATCM